MSQEITKEQIAAFDADFSAQRANRVAMNAVTNNGLLASAIRREAVEQDVHEYSISLEQGEICNQKQSGRCWMFAALNTLRYQVMKKYDLKTFELSQAYLFFWDKLEKSNYFLESILETLDELAAMAKLLLPTIAAAMAGGGCVGSASVWQVGALMLSDIFLSLMRDVLVPVLYCMIGTAAAGALLEQSRLSLLSKGIGKLLSWGLSAILIVFTAFLSVSNLLAGSADRLAVKVGKTVISGAVPIVGGILSEATEALLAGAGALRSTLGVLGVFAVLSLCLAPLLRLTVQYLLYRAAAFFCGMVGSDTLRSFLEQLSSAFSLMLAMTAGGAFLLLVSLLIAMMMVVTV